MAIQWADNFSLYGSDIAFMLNGPYAEVVSGSGAGGVSGLVDDPDPNIASTVFRLAGGQGNITQYQNYFRRVLSGSLGTVGVCFRLWLEGLPSDSRQYLIITQFRDASNGALISVLVGSTGQILVKSGGPTAFATSGADPFPGAILAQTSGPVVTANAWQHVAIQATFDASTGTVDVEVEGVPVMAATGLNTKPTGNNAAAVQVHNFCARTPNGPSTAYDFYVKDLVSWDSFGSYNNDFLGSVVAYALVPDGDVNLNWTPSTGSTGYSILDNRPAVDAQYIEADVTPPAPYLGTLSNLPVDVTSVRAVITTVRAAKVDGGDGNLQVSLVSGADTADGADRPITGAMTFWQDTFEEDPATSAPWTPGAVDAVQIQLNRTV